jgi:hypothetical protein
MKKEASLLFLTCAPAAWLFAGGIAQACPLEEYTDPDHASWCGQGCGFSSLPEVRECSGNDDGCTERVPMDFIVCSHCVSRHVQAEFCGGAGCSCEAGSCEEPPSCSS